MATYSNTVTRHRHVELLPARELELVALIASGKTTVEIAERLGMRPSAVNGCALNLCADTGVQHRARAAQVYLEQLRSADLPMAA
jgi:DNA-binding CsgD family transcriptional regulator